MYTFCCCFLFCDFVVVASQISLWILRYIETHEISTITQPVHSSYVEVSNNRIRSYQPMIVSAAARLNDAKIDKQKRNWNNAFGARVLYL